MADPVAPNSVTVRGAREHNLKGIDLTFPREALVTFTGVSGSGKSSLAYHTIYQEGQRRFLESLSSYARQFLGRMEKPKVDHVEGLSPTVSIDQKSTGASPRSTVGTMTEVLDFLRLLWARLGVPVCPECQAPIETWSTDRIVEAVLAAYAEQPILVLAPVIRERKGEYRKELADFRARGFVRARIDGEVRRLDEEIDLHRYKYHTIELVLDRLKAEPDKASRLAEAIEQALVLADGLVAIVRNESDDYRTFSTQRACPNGHGSIPEMEPRLFSFNSPVGACPACDGLGTVQSFSEDLLVRDASLSLAEGALHVITDEGRLVYSNYSLEHFALVGKEFGFDLTTAWKALSVKARKVILHGSGKTTFRFAWQRQGAKWTAEGSEQRAFPGVVPHLKRIYSPGKARHLDRYQAQTACPACDGERLGPVGRSVTFHGKRLPEVLAAPVADTLAFFSGLRLQGNAAVVGEEITREVLDRLHFLHEVGLGYLTLERRADTLSGGEAQRIRLAAQVGSGLRGVLYVLDEPSIGLHARDQDRLLATLRALRDRGNTVCVVEHDEETMRHSDFLVDVGPGAGVHGGEIVAAGTPAQVMATKASLTGRFLRGDEKIVAADPERRPGSGEFLVVEGARHHNLKDVDARFPLGCFVAVTGVSGSGKSTLVNHVLKRALRRTLHNALDVPGQHDRITGLKHLDKIIEIDQQPIGRTPRSNPGTYTGVWDHVRDLFAALPESRLREYKKGRFSFNVPGGRCEACEGAGVQVLEMQFLAPVEVTCDVCQGQRFNPETLEITFKDRNVAQVLDLTIEEALELFANLPKIATGLYTLNAVGLGYLKLGQTSTTLSGGEAQRVKLATELQRPATGRTLYVLDEPTTGLHFADVRRLLACLHALVDAGNTVLVIEHNLDVIRSADWLVDLGPEGGAGGGRIVAEGTPEQVAKTATFTGRALAAAFAGAAVPTALPKPAPRTPPSGRIEIRGARKNNLQGVNVALPLGKFAVVTGPSGSGKSSLAFDTLFSEGQRRFIESLSTYARRFLGRMDRAPVDAIEGLGPSIAIDQRAASRSPRSTVATTTEIQDYLRLLWARIGRPHCPNHGQELVQHSPSSIAKLAGDEFGTKKGYVLAPVHVPHDVAAATGAAGKKKLAAFVDGLRVSWKEKGFARALVNGAEWRLEQPLPDLGEAAALKLHLVVDRVAFTDRKRIVDAAAQAAHEGHGLVALRTTDGEERLFSTDRSCPLCGFSVPVNPHPRYFSFNHHSGACTECSGLGQVVACDPALLVNHPDKPLFAGGIDHRGAVFTFLTKRGGWYHSIAEQLAKARGFDLGLPFARLPKAAQHELLWGSSGERFEVTYRSRKPGVKRSWRAAIEWKGIAKQIEGWFRGGTQNESPDRLAAVMRTQACPACGGSRLGVAQRHVLVAGITLPEFTAFTVEEALRRLDGLRLRKTEKEIAVEVLKEIGNRLRFLASVGLEYLTLDRSAATLSGGEAQRIRLATQLGNRLVGVLYVLDEPTIGLHPRDTERLLNTLFELRDLGNTVVAVEHDEHVIRRADWIVDMGPGAGRYGGKVVACGPPAAVERGDALTARYLRGELGVPVPETRRAPVAVLKLKKLRAHNVDGVDLDLPLGVLVAVTGVSGSGKSSLVMDAVLPELQRLAARAPRAEPLVVVEVDQSPIGTTPSSVPASYVEVLTPIRELFASTPQAKVKGFRAGRFSFNVADGRCKDCEGKGQVKVEMHFLADVWITCETCKGKRYDAETLSVRYRDRNIADVLQMEAAQALEFFGNHPRIRAPLQTMVDIGLGYLQLGQPAPTLSGGEAQRLKLVPALARPLRGHTIFVLDEPTTGLHLDDVKKLIETLQRLVARGDTVIVIEHHLDVVKCADVVLEMGPEAGAKGGQIVAQGTPEEVAKTKCHTARFLREALARKVAANVEPRQVEAEG